MKGKKRIIFSIQLVSYPQLLSPNIMNLTGWCSVLLIKHTHTTHWFLALHQQHVIKMGPLKHPILPPLSFPQSHFLYLSVLLSVTFIKKKELYAGMFSNPWTMWRSLVLSAQSLQQHWHLKCVLKDKADLMKYFFLPLSVFFPVNIKNVFECSVFSCRLPVDALVTSLRNNIWVMSHSNFFLTSFIIALRWDLSGFQFWGNKTGFTGKKQRANVSTYVAP